MEGNTNQVDFSRYEEEQPTKLSDLLAALRPAREAGLDGLSLTPHVLHLDLDDDSIQAIELVLSAISNARSKPRWVSILVMLFPIFKRIYQASRNPLVPTTALK